MKTHRPFFTLIFRIISIFILLSALLVNVNASAIAFNIQPSPWTQNAKLTASDHTSGDKLGWSVAIDGNITVVGAPGGLSDPGAAYIFTKSGAAWSQTAKLTASDGAGADEFGASVAVEGNTVVVGAPGDNTDEGAAYVFTESGGVWSEAGKLTASTGNSNDNFGSSVNINGDTIIIGAPGAANYASWGTGRAFVFVKQGTGWTTQNESALLEADYGTNSFLHNGDEFGRSVAVSGDTIAVGAPEVNLNGSNSGLVYIFEKPSGGWTGTLNENANIYPKTPNSTEVYVHFGFSVDIDDETIAAGAYGDTLNNGRAYLFEKGSGWTTGADNRVAELSASDIATLDEFGYAVSVDGNVAAVGAPWDDDNGSNSGSVYLFEKPESGWANATETEKVTGSDNTDNNYLGRAIASSGYTLVAGAPFHDLSGPGSEGAAYVFKSPPAVIINEVDADTPGTDAAEFIELYDGGSGNTSLNGLVLVFHNGADDRSYRSFDLDGYATDANGYFVLCGESANVANCDDDVSPDTNLLQNGADAVALYMGDATDFPNDTPVAPVTTNLLDALVYDTDDGDDAGLLVLLNTGQPQINEDGGGSGVSPTVSLQRCANGSGGQRNTSTYGQFSPTPGTVNCPPDIDVQRPASTSIADGGTDAQGTKKSGEQVTLTYTIENQGDSTLNISNITAANETNVSVGTISPTTLNVTVGNTAIFDVPYTPAAGSGAFSFDLDISSDDPDEANYNITVSGTRDGDAPSVTIEQGATQADPTNASPIIFDVEFSESVTGFDENDVNISGMAATPTIVVNGNAADYTVEVSGMVDGETVTATIPANAAQDEAGNDNLASTSVDNSVTYGNIPTVIFNANTTPPNGASLTTGPSQIKIEFSQNVTTASVEDESNYLLVEAGTNDIFDTTSCAVPGGDTAAPDDLKITVNNALYDDTDPFISTLEINSSAPLPYGKYRLFICGTTSIENAAGIHLNNGADSHLDFTIEAAPAPNPNDGETKPTLPKTGFRHGRVTSLAQQPPAKAYTDTAMTLEIPKLGVTMPIVGVPQTKDGWNVTWLGNSAGYLYGSAFPTWAGNTVITGHVWDAYNRPGAFAEIKNLGYGDQVQIHAWGVTYTYEVRESKLVTKKNTNAVFQSEEYDWLTLVTCEFYNPLNGEYLFRRAVRAVLISVQ